MMQRLWLRPSLQHWHTPDFRQVYPTTAARNQRPARNQRSARSTVTGIAKARREKRKRRARK